MPTVGSSHLLEARALACVQTILAHSDALSEIIKNDYGEDMIVQTNHKGFADTFQILIQVKGSSVLKYKDGSFNFRFSRDHILRWILHSSNILICVYDDLTKNVYCFDPKLKFSLWDVKNSQNKSFAIRLGPNDQFTNSTASSIIWRCRLTYFSNMLAISENRLFYTKLHESDRKFQKQIQRENGLLCLLIMQMLGIINDDEFNPSIRSIIRNGASYFPEKWPDEKWSLRDLMQFAVIGEVNEVTGCGIPSNVMEQLTEAAGHFYRHFHKEEWSTANSQLDLEWTPYRGITERRQ